MKASMNGGGIPGLVKTNSKLAEKVIFQLPTLFTMNKETAELLAMMTVTRYMLDDCLTSDHTPQKTRSAAAQADVALKRVEVEIYAASGQKPPVRRFEDIVPLQKAKKRSWWKFWGKS